MLARVEKYRKIINISFQWLGLGMDAGERLRLGCKNMVRGCMRKSEVTGQKNVKHQNKHMNNYCHHIISH